MSATSQLAGYKVSKPASPSKTTSAPRKTFFDLPTELREKIYIDAVAASMSTYDSQSSTTQCHHPCAESRRRSYSAIVSNPAPLGGKCTAFCDKGCPTVLLICKQIYGEALRLVWEAKTRGFRFCSAICYMKFMEGITTDDGKQALFKAGSIHIDFG